MKHVKLFEHFLNEKVKVNSSTYKVANVISKELDAMKNQKNNTNEIQPIEQLLNLFKYNNDPETHINKPEFRHLKQAYIKIKNKYNL